MKKSIVGLVFLAAGVVLAGCGRQAAEQPAAAGQANAASFTVFGLMNGTIIPSSNRIWELAGNLYDDNGNLDASRLSEQQWVELKESAAAIAATSKILAQTAGIKAAPTGVKIQSEGEPGSLGAAEVQRLMDKDPASFSEHAMQLAAVADEIGAAAWAREAKKTDEAQTRMTEVCGACHQKFWYPEQAAQ